jgi:hypothetical protein
MLSQHHTLPIGDTVPNETEDILLLLSSKQALYPGENEGISAYRNLREWKHDPKFLRANGVWRTPLWMGELLIVPVETFCGQQLSDGQFHVVCAWRLLWIGYLFGLKSKSIAGSGRFCLYFL